MPSDTLNSSDNNFAIPRDDKQLMPRIGHFCDIRSDLVGKILREGPKQIGRKPKNSATELDIFSVSGLEDNEIIDLIQSKTSIDIRTQEGLKKIQDLHSRAVCFYEEELYRVPGRDAREMKFRTVSSVIDFMRKTASESTRRQTICNLIKIMFTMSQYDKADKLKELDEKAILAIKDFFIPHMQITSKNGFPEKSQETQACIVIDDGDRGQRVINFGIKFRAKASNSSILKMLYNPEYSTAELISDAIGIEYECDTEEDILLVQRHFHDNIYEEHGKGLIYTDKHIVSGLVSLGDILQRSSPDFAEKIGKRDNDKKPISGVSYRDFKVNLDLPVSTDPYTRNAMKKYTGFEIRGILKDNRNNSGLNDGRIYDQSKRLHAMIRLQGYITEDYIKKVVNKFYERFPEAKFSKENLLEKFLGGLKKMHIPRLKNVLYTTPERYETLTKEPGLYPTEAHLGS